MAKVRLTPLILFVRNFDHSMEFYRRVFDLEPIRVYKGPDHPDWVEFQIGEVRLALHAGYKGTQQYAPGRPLTIHFEVEDIRVTIERIERYGGSVKGTPQEYDFRPVELERVSATAFLDPDGNEFELQQVLEVFTE